VLNRALTPYLWMLCSCFCFAWMSSLASSLSQDRACDWRLIALVRCSLALLFAILLARLTGARLVFRRPGILWVRSLAGSLSMVCTFYAFSRLRSSEVLTLTNTFPIWVAVLSWPLFRERPPPSVWPAAACGLAGVVLIQQPHFEGANLAIPLALFAAISSAVAMLGLHHLRGVQTTAIVAHFSGVATLFALGACFVGAPPRLEQLTEGWNLPLLLGVGLTATVGQVFLTLAFSAGPPAKVSVVGLTQIAFAMALELLLGGPAFSPLTLAGIGLVMAPTAWMMAARSG
jgi:drug/metabolite transporter (DMT)-like permease